jgi:hypothetical protein
MVFKLHLFKKALNIMVIKAMNDIIRIFHVWEKWG